MKIGRLHFTPTMYLNCLTAFVIVVLMTIPLLFIGRDTLGEAVIAMLYLVPVGYSAAKWGQGAGICSAVTAALMFDFFFIPPFYTFAVGRLESWLVLIIFLVVSIVVVGRIQDGLTKAQTSEREAVFMYELSSALAGLRTQESVIRALSNNIQFMFQAHLVEVCIQSGIQSPGTVFKTPSDGIADGMPDRILPILASPGLVGEIRIWKGSGWLPEEGSRLLHNITVQAAQALERARLSESEALAISVANG